MATDQTRDFDPRFDPAFQRGFDGAAPAAAARTPAARPDQRPYDAPVTRVAEPALPVAERTVMPPTPGQSALPVVRSVESDETDVAPAPARDRRANPFLVALAVVSVVLVAGGAWGVQAARAPFLQTNAAAGTDFVGLQMLVLAAPLAIILGIATGVGIVFFYAAQWQRGR